jgi:diadenosine tetraphosphate (Ap4A) HIT family hydrolase
MFELNATLKKDTFFIKDLNLCKLLLLNNKFYPWLILVPKRKNLSETFDLTLEDQLTLTKEINQISILSKEFFKADKINLAAFGNVVPQLHIHIIARYKSDRTFPNPVWLDKEKEQYQKAQAKDLIEKLLIELN